MEDTNMYTGASSGTVFGNEEQPAEVKEMREEEDKRLQELLPSLEIIFEFVNNEKQAIVDIRAYMKTLGEKPSASAIQDEYRARELYIGFLDRFQINVQNQLHAYEEAKRSAKR
jgi:hypothetical protein